VYDITNRWSFDGIDRWIKEIDEVRHNPSGTSLYQMTETDCSWYFLLFALAVAGSAYYRVGYPRCQVYNFLSVFRILESWKHTS